MGTTISYRMPNGEILNLEEGQVPPEPTPGADKKAPQATTEPPQIPGVAWAQMLDPKDLMVVVPDFPSVPLDEKIEPPMAPRPLFGVGLQAPLPKVKETKAGVTGKGSNEGTLIGGAWQTDATYAWNHPTYTLSLTPNVREEYTVHAPAVGQIRDEQGRTVLAWPFSVGARYELPNGMALFGNAGGQAAPPNIDHSENIGGQWTVFRTKDGLSFMVNAQFGDRPGFAGRKAPFAAEQGFELKRDPTHPDGGLGFMINGKVVEAPSGAGTKEGHASVNYKGITLPNGISLFPSAGVDHIWSQAMVPQTHLPSQINGPSTTGGLTHIDAAWASVKFDKAKDWSLEFKRTWAFDYNALGPDGRLGVHSTNDQILGTLNLNDTTALFANFSLYQNGHVVPSVIGGIRYEFPAADYPKIPDAPPLLFNEEYLRALSRSR